MTDQKIRLLLIENNPEDVRRMRTALREDEHQKYEIRQVGSLADGLVALSKKMPDAILVNLELSDSRGLETFTCLQSRVPQLPILVLAGAEDMQNAIRAVHSGAQDFLSKDDLTGDLLRRSLRYALERNKTDLIMRESAAQWQTTFNATSDGICILDTERNIIRTNLGMQILFQFRPDEMLGKKIWEIVHDKKQPPKDCPTLQLTKDSKRAMELINRGKRWLEMTADSILDASGDWIGSVHNFRDVTDRTNTEQAILHLAETQRQITSLENTHQIYELVGSRIQELIGEGIVAISHLDEKSQHMHMVGFYGFGDVFDQLVQRFKLDPYKMSFPISEMPAEDLLLFRSGRLEIYKNGIYGLSLKKLSKRICALVEKELKLRCVYSMGFVWEDTHHGGLTILAKSDLAPFKEMIETIVNQATLAIERIRSEQSLRSSEAQYRLLAENIQDVIWIMDINPNKFVYVSPSVIDLRGYTPEEVMAAPVSASMTDTSAREVESVLQRNLEAIARDDHTFNETTYTVEQPCKDGSTVWTEVTVNFVFNQDGVPTQIIGVSRDISQRKRSENELRASHSLLEATLESTSEGILVVDLQGNLVRYNHKYAEIWMIPQPLLDKGKIDEILTNLMGLMVDPEAFISSTRQVYAEPGAGSFDSLELKDGRIVERSSQPQLLGESIAGRVWSFRDVTDRRRAEEGLLKLKKAADSSNEVIFLTDLNGLITYINPEFTTLYGFSADEVVGKTTPRILKSGCYTDDHYSNFWDLLLKDQPVMGEMINKTREGRLITIESSVNPIRDDNGNRIGFVAIQRDISERKHNEQALLESESKLRESQRVSRIGSYSMALKTDNWVSSEVLDELFGIASDFEKNTASWNKLIHPDEQKVMLDYFQQVVIQAGQPFNKEYRIVRPSDGEVRWMWGLGSLTYDENGIPVTMIGTIQDVTERKQAELELQESHSLLTNTIESTADGILVVDLEGRISLANGRFAEMWGIPQSVLDKHDDAAALAHVMDKLKEPQDFIAKVQELYATPAVESFDEIEFKDQHIFERISQPQFQGENIVGRVWIFRDITERKQAEILQQAVYQISLAAEASHALDELYPSIHQIISSVMPAENFYITLYDEKRDLLTFTYFKDTQDEPFMGEIQPGRGLTAYVLRTGKSLLCTQKVHDELERKREIKLLGVPSAIWLGVPLIVEGKAIGVMVVQHYTDEKAYGLREQHMLEFVSTQVAIVINRKQSEQALQDSETQFRTLVEQLPAIVYIDDVTVGPGHTIYVSPQIQTLLGVTPEEWMEGDLDVWLAHIRPGDRDRILGDYMRCYQEGEPVNSEYCMVATDGRLVWILDQAQLLRDEHGKQHSIHGVMYDITERKQRDETLRTLSNRQEAILSSVPDIIMQVDNEKIYTWVNQAGLEFFGEDVVGKEASYYFMGEQQTYSLVQPLFDGNEDVIYLESWQKRKDGMNRLLGWWCKVLKDADGNITGALSSARDITEQEQAEILQQAVYKIALATETTRSLDELYPTIHQIIASVMPAENFYITLVDEERDVLNFPYFRDEVDEPFKGEVKPGHGLTDYVLRTGRSLLCDQKLHDELEHKGKIKLLGVPSAIWLGVPLIADEKVIGTMVVQHYTDAKAYGPHEQQMLEFVSSQVAIAISRKQSEEKLLKSEERFKQISENAGEWIWEVDETGLYTFTNSLVEQKLGYTSAEIVGKRHFCDFFAPDVRDNLKEAAMTRFALKQSIIGLVNPNQHKDGHIIILETNASPLLDKNGELLGYRGADIDITEREQAALSLRTSEERYRSLFNNMLDGYSYCRGIFDGDQLQDFVYLAVNEKFGELTGLQDVVGRKISQVIPGLMETNLNIFEIYGRVALSGIPEKFESYLPELEIWLSISVHSSEKGYFNAVFDNITEHKRSEALTRLRLVLLEYSTSHSLEDILQKTLDEVEVLTGSSIGFYHFVNQDQENLTLQAWSTRTKKEFCQAEGQGSHYAVSQAGIWAECIRTRKPVVHNDYASMPDRKGMPAGHATVVRELVVPILRGEIVVAVLGIGNKIKDYNQSDVNLVTYLADTSYEFVSRKIAEDQIVESEIKYRSLFDNVPDGVYRTTPDGKFLTVNQEAVNMMGFASTDELMNASAESFYYNKEDRDEFIRLMEERGEVHNLEVHFKNKDGRNMVLLENARAYRDENGKVLFYEGTLTDITDRKKSETERQTLLEIIQGLMITDDLHDYLQVVHQAIAKVIYAENFFVMLKNKETDLFEQAYLVDKYDGPVPPSELGKTLSAYVYRTSRPFLFDQSTFDELISQGEVELVGANSPSWLGVPLVVSRETIGVLVIQDYETENRYTEHDVELLSSIAGQVALVVKRKYAETELARLFEREKRRVVRLSELQVISADLNSLHSERELMKTLVNRAAALSNSPVSTIMMLDESKTEVILLEHTGLPNNIPPVVRIPVKALPEEVMVFQKGDPIIVADIDRDMPSLRRVLLHPDVRSFSAFPLSIGGRVAGVITLSTFAPHVPSEAEINAYQLLARLASAALDNVRLFEGINRSLKRMGSLRRVDMAISSSFDLMLTLNILLEQVTSHLEVDAADVLVFDQGDSTLKYTCGRGFRGQALKFTNLHLGEGYAGRAALERRTIHIPDINQEHSDLDKSTSLKSEDFVSYWGVPLLGKGHIQGVLEVFHRQPLNVDQEWLDFLETLAGQAAIAIDNVHLFDHLERSNADLSMAYDSTLAGWATALEMRDNETEGHTRRVAATTMKLAGRLGLHDQDIMFLRWGSLLHDIGKMGIPDTILLKPGPLNDEEWVIMRKHPRLAYEMLAPIAYLREALDIPYSHHEKWDGSGYPQQLKGEQIPMAARIFSIVDVWDALTSDRPYRKAWTSKKTLEYIRTQEGIHFDPQVVRAFLQMIDEESQLMTLKRE